MEGEKILHWLTNWESEGKDFPELSRFSSFLTYSAQCAREDANPETPIFAGKTSKVYFLSKELSRRQLHKLEII
jgi:hypothetical protein